jgi:tetratricopeptide (TPR) repeat protein
MNRLKTLLCAAFLVLPLLASAGVEEVQRDWAIAMYQTPEKERVHALSTLAAAARDLVKAQPDNAAALIWEGIVLSTYAGEKGGLGALGLCKEARAALEQALAIDPNALQGSAHTSLGSLYYQVPGWPIGFGDHKLARKHLELGLAQNPDGIDPNYFMADFLHESGDDDEALGYLDKAAHAPARPGRELADQGRQQEIVRLRNDITAD